MRIALKELARERREVSQCALYSFFGRLNPLVLQGAGVASASPTGPLVTIDGGAQCGTRGSGYCGVPQLAFVLYRLASNGAAARSRLCVGTL